MGLLKCFAIIKFLPIHKRPICVVMRVGNLQGDRREIGCRLHRAAHGRTGERGRVLVIEMLNYIQQTK